MNHHISLRHLETRIKLALTNFYRVIGANVPRPNVELEIALLYFRTKLLVPLEHGTILNLKLSSLQERNARLGGTSSRSSLGQKRRKCQRLCCGHFIWRARIAPFVPNIGPRSSKILTPYIFRSM